MSVVKIISGKNKILTIEHDAKAYIHDDGYVSIVGDTSGDPGVNIDPEFLRAIVRCLDVDCVGYPKLARKAE
ncbi:MAG: hypothetical protein KGH64_02930 [Candidatus Micrarchaeota archaeon]|nr:hypothetical protein [Candidatus Micrarchaeota archaeon]